VSNRKYEMGSVVSKDGTAIGYRQMGDGPGVILFHGGANASQSYSKLGAALSDAFTVYIPDRRETLKINVELFDPSEEERLIEALKAMPPYGQTDAFIGA